MPETIAIVLYLLGAVLALFHILDDPRFSIGCWSGSKFGDIMLIALWPLAVVVGLFIAARELISDYRRSNGRSNDS